MAISLVGGDSGAAINGDDVTLSMPVGIATGDVVYIAYSVGCEHDQDMSVSGYFQLADLYSQDANDANLGVFRKVQGATPDTTAVCGGTGTSTDSTAAVFYCLRGVDTTTPEDAATTTATGTNTGQADPPAITPVTDGAWVLAIGASSDPDPAGGLPWDAPPAGYGNHIAIGGNDSDDCSALISSKEIATAGTPEDPGIYEDLTTNSDFAWCAATVAVRPVVDSGHTLLANDVESDSEVTAPAIGQVHAILANDVQSTSNVTAPALGQVHTLSADDVESASEVSEPAIVLVTPLTAEDVESASEVTAPALAQVHVLLANDAESASEVSSPAVGQVHALAANDVQSASEASAPAIGQTHVLAANDVESASELTAPTLASAGEHALLADDVQSLSELSVPALGQTHALLANDVESASEVGAPALGSAAEESEEDTHDWVSPDEVRRALKALRPTADRLQEAIRQRNLLEDAFASALAELEPDVDEPVEQRPPTPEVVVASPTVWPSLVPIAQQVLEVAREIARLRDEEEAAFMLMVA